MEIIPTERSVYYGLELAGLDNARAFFDATNRERGRR